MTRQKKFRKKISKKNFKKKNFKKTFLNKHFKKNLIKNFKKFEKKTGSEPVQNHGMGFRGGSKKISEKIRSLANVDLEF